MNFLFAFLGAMILITACKKTPAPDPHESVFVNQHEVPIFIKAYASLQDYAQNGPTVWETQLGPLDKIYVPSETLPTGKTYYIDWFSADYQLHNWYNSQDLSPRIQPNLGENNFDIYKDLKGPARKAFLDGSGTSTRWKAVDKLLYSSSLGFVSYWDSASTMEKNRVVEVRKDFTALYQFIDESQQPDSLVMPIVIHKSEFAYLEFRGPQGENLGSMIGGRLPPPSGMAPDYSSTSTDSLLALFADSEFYYLMIKE